MRPGVAEKKLFIKGREVPHSRFYRGKRDGGSAGPGSSLGGRTPRGRAGTATESALNGPSLVSPYAADGATPIEATPHPIIRGGIDSVRPAAVNRP